MGRTVTVHDVKSGNIDDLLDAVEEAASTGIKVLQVLNRGRAIMFLGPEGEMPEKWHKSVPATVAISTLKKEKISLLRLQKERKALVLSLRSDKTLALWPVEDDPRSELEITTDDLVYRVTQLEITADDRVSSLEEKIERLEICNKKI